MPLSVALLLFVAVFAATIALNAFFLWLGGRLWRIEKLRYRRALIAALLLAVVAIVFRLGILYATRVVQWRSEPGDPFDPPPFGAEEVVALVGGVLWLAATWWVLKRLLRTTAGKAVLAGVTMLIPGAILSVVGALAIRTWLLEAFVVPTGAMAPTIIGAHADLTCGHCGRPYTVGLSLVAEGPSGVLAEAVTSRCPNCGRPNNVPPGTPIRTGDCVLVDKTTSPRRWDLFVFQYPADPSTLYIKRLVGLPGERLEIFGGDVFIDGRRLRKEPGTAEDLWLPVHDSRYVPRQEVPDGPGWISPDAGWRGDGDDWRCDATGERECELVFRGLTADQAYNVLTPWEIENAPSLPVADIKLSADIENLTGAGELVFVWELGPQRLEAAVSGTGQVELTVRSDPEGAEPAGTSRGQLFAPIKRSRRLALVVRDGQARLTQNGKPVVSARVLPDSLEEARSLTADAAAPCRLSIQARDCQVALSQVVLHRDVYYTTLEEMNVHERDLENDRAGDRIELAADEYFGLGDNSQRSKDSRFFGPIREPALTGVARWIYWPPQRWHELH